VRPQVLAAGHEDMSAGVVEQFHFTVDGGDECIFDSFQALAGQSQIHSFFLVHNFQIFLKDQCFHYNGRPPEGQAACEGILKAPTGWPGD